MSTADEILTATRTNNVATVKAFTEHSNGSREDTQQHLLNSLRQCYPDHHVTAVKEDTISLFEFSRADKAKCTLDFADEDFHAVRHWHTVGEGVEKQLHPGALKDKYTFARFEYIWEDHTYIVYHAKWKPNPWACHSIIYILYPRADAKIEGGHCAEIDALVLAAGKWSSQLHDEMFVFDDAYWEKSKELWESVKHASWDDVILNPDLKKTIIEDVQGFFDNKDMYKQFGVPWKRGVILHGVPGNGKTISVKALVNSLNNRAEPIPALYVKSLMTQNNTEQYCVRKIFEQARQSAPCLLIFEDLDSLVTDKVRSYFLNEVDGLESNDGILMIGSTNHLSKLDPAIAKRPSRFDRKFEFKIPAEAERKQYAEYWRQKLESNETIEYPEELTDIIAKLTEGFSFAYLKELYVISLLNLVRGYKGEDFEFVEADEAASADGDKDEAANAKTEEGDKDQDVCICASKCSTCSKPLPQTKKDEKKEDDDSSSKDKSSKTTQKKLVMPTVDIPSHLSENLFLKVIKYQIRALHSEMDNTSDE